MFSRCCSRLGNMWVDDLFGPSMRSTSVEFVMGACLEPRGR